DDTGEGVKRRGRQRRERFVRSTVGAAIVAGLALATWATAPERQEFVIEAPAIPLTVDAAIASIDEQKTSSPLRATATPDTALTEAAASGAPPGVPVAEYSDIAPQTIKARPGETPLTLLTRIGVARGDAEAAVRQLGTVWDPRGLKAGQRA